MVTITNRRAEPKRIDYDRMKREWPKQKAALTRAVKTGDPVKIADVCIKAVAAWDQIGGWPDDWSRFERALNDALPWSMQVTLVEVAYGHVTISH